MANGIDKYPVRQSLSSLADRGRKEADQAGNLLRTSGPVCGLKNCGCEAIQNVQRLKKTSAVAKDFTTTPAAYPPLAPHEEQTAAYFAASLMATSNPVDPSLTPGENQTQFEKNLDRAETLSSPGAREMLRTANQVIGLVRSKVHTRSNVEPDLKATHNQALFIKRAVFNHLDSLPPADRTLERRAAVTARFGAGSCGYFANVVACEMAPYLKPHQTLYVVKPEGVDHEYVVLDDPHAGVRCVLDAWAEEGAMLAADHEYVNLPNQVILRTVSGKEGKKVHESYKQWEEAYRDKARTDPILSEYRQLQALNEPINPELLWPGASCMVPAVRQSLERAHASADPLKVSLALVHGLRSGRSVAEAAFHAGQPAAATYLEKFLDSRAGNPTLREDVILV